MQFLAVCCNLEEENLTSAKRPKLGTNFTSLNQLSFYKNSNFDFLCLSYISH